MTAIFLTGFFFGIALIFYTISDRLNTTVRAGLEASTFSMIKQLSTVFMIFAGLIFLKEPFVINKFIGAILIIASNILIFYKKGEGKPNKYIILGIIANICYTIALFLDVNISNNFNLPFYITISLGIPAILIAIIEKIKITDIKNEFINGNTIKSLSIGRGKCCSSLMCIICYFKCYIWLFISK